MSDSNPHVSGLPSAFWILEDQTVQVSICIRNLRPAPTRFAGGYPEDDDDGEEFWYTGMCASCGNVCVHAEKEV